MWCAKRLQADILHRFQQPDQPGAQRHGQSRHFDIGGRDGFDRPAPSYSASAIDLQVNRVGNSGDCFYESRGQRRVLGVAIVRRFGLGRRPVSDRLEDPAVVEPIDPLEGWGGSGKSDRSLRCIPSCDGGMPMSSKRRRFSGEQKAKIALEALRGRSALQEICPAISGPSEPGWRLEAPGGRRLGRSVLEGRRAADPGP